MLPVITILGRPLPVGTISLLLAIYVGIELTERSLARLAPKEQSAAWRQTFTRATMVAIAVGIIGARLGYAMRYYQLYIESPGLLVSLRPGTLAVVPGLLLGGACALFYLARKQILLSKIADASAVGLIGALFVVDIGNFFTGHAYGTATVVPWGVELWQATRHPVQLYDAVSLLFILGAMWYLQKNVLDGELFWRFLMLYSVSQLFLGMFYATSAVWGLGIRINQVIALASLLVSLFVLSFFAQQRERDEDHAKYGTA